MSSGALYSALASAALILTLHLWRALYPSSDLAALALLLLALLIFAGHFPPGAALYRARINAAIRDGSPLGAILTGRLRAFLEALLFTLIAIPLLAFQALAAGAAEIAVLVMLSLIAAAAGLYARHRLSRHFHPAYARAGAISLASWTTALAFVPILAWANWNFAEHSGAIRAASLSEAVVQAIAALPPRRGIIAEILAPLYAFEAAKLWLAVQAGAQARWATVLFSLDSALICFIVARASIVLAFLAQRLNEERKP